jgi:hypothetical protein
MALTIGGGITLGGGISLGTPPSFTVTSSDVSNPQLLYSGYSSYSSSGFTSNGTQLYNGISYEITPEFYATLLAVQAQAGFDANDAWVWQVNWNTGGTCLVRLGIVSGTPNFIVIAPIDQTDTRWQSNNTNGPTLTGTFTFPAVFTAYSPATAIGGNNGWC